MKQIRNVLKFLSLVVMLTGIVLISYSFAGDKDCTPPSGKGIQIWFDVGGSPGEPYATVLYNGAKAAACDSGAEVKYVYSDWSPEKMIGNFKQAVASKPDGIVVIGIPGDDAYEPFIDEAIGKGILVTCIDTNLPRIEKKYQSKGFGYVGTDNYQQGKMLAEEALKRSKLGKDDKAFVWGLKRLQDRGRRATAIIEVLKSAGMKVDYQEISPEIDKDASLGTPVITGYLAANPDCRMIVTDHGALTSQVGNFLRAAAIKPNTIFVAGFSLSPATATAIREGYVSLVSEAQPYLMGYLSVLQIVQSSKYGFSGLNIDTGGGFVAKDNIEQIAPLAQKGIR